MFPIKSMHVTSIEPEENYSYIKGDSGKVVYSIIYEDPEPDPEPDPEWLKFKEEHDIQSDSDDSDSDEEITEEYDFINSTKAKKLNNSLEYNPNGQIDITTIQNINISLKNCLPKKLIKLEETKFYTELSDVYKFDKKNPAKDLLHKVKTGQISPSKFMYILFDCDVCFIGDTHRIYVVFYDKVTYEKYDNGICDCGKVRRLSGEQMFSFDELIVETRMIHNKLYETWCCGRGWIETNLPVRIVSSPKERKFWFTSTEYDYIKEKYIAGEETVHLCKHSDILINANAVPRDENFNYREFNRIFQETIDHLENLGYECLNDKNDIIVF